MRVKVIGPEDIPKVSPLLKASEDLVKHLYEERKFYGVIAEEEGEIKAVVAVNPHKPPRWDEEGYAASCIMKLVSNDVSWDTIDQLLEVMEGMIPSAELSIMSLTFSFEGKEQLELIREMVEGRGYDLKGEVKLYKFWA